MLDVIDDLPGDQLELDAYLDDFDAHFSALRDLRVWKIERRQEFRQPESESWTAFSQGRWADALRLLEDNRPALEEEFQQISQTGSSVHRVRVVEQPIAPYLQWELHSLHLRAQCGENIRVLPFQQVAPFERVKPVPEVVTLGERVTYKILYTEQGVLQGAVRFTDPDVTAGCRADIEKLYEAGEDLAPFFERDVAHLNPPRGQ